MGRRYFCFAGVAQPEEQAAFNRQAVGSSPTTCISFSFACVAQLAEQPALNRQVQGSKPCARTNASYRMVRMRSATPQQPVRFRHGALRIYFLEEIA